MLLKDVWFSHRPEKIIINKINSTYQAKVDLPVNIKKHTDAEGDYYTADVYTLIVGYSNTLKEQVEKDYDKWVAMAATSLPVEPTLQDAIDAINALTEIVLGGE